MVHRESAKEEEGGLHDGAVGGAREIEGALAVLSGELDERRHTAIARPSGSENLSSVTTLARKQLTACGCCGASRSRAPACSDRA